MIQLFTKKNGAVSVFLTIVLVPILIISCLFVDASRIKLARGVVASAGDLTLNTALTQYDSDLNDYYGMLASSQDMTEFLSNADDYFTACITSQGVDITTAKGLSQEIMGLLTGTGGEISDLLQMSVVEEGAYEITAVTDGNLANPALIKKEIVEFMKYRSPVNAIADVIDKLSSASDTLQTAEDDAELTDKKQDYYEAEGEVVEKALEVYKKIVEYEKLNINAASVEEMKTAIENVKNVYKECHIKMVKDLYNTQNLQFKGSGVLTSYTVSASDVVPKQINGYIHDAAVSMREFIDVATSLENSNSVIERYDSSTMYPLQYWVAAEKVLYQNSSYTSYASKANNLIQNMEKLRVALEQLSDDEKAEEYNLSAQANVTDSGKKTRQAHYDALNEQYSLLKTEYLHNTNSAYNYLVETLSGISYEYRKNTSTSEVNQKINEIYTQFNAYYDEFDDAITILGDAVKNLEELKKLIADYKSAYSSWEKKATSYTSEMSKIDQAEIESLETTIIENITDERINELITRFNNVKSLLGSLKDGIDEYKYNKTKIRNIDGYTTFKSKSGVSEKKISYYRSDLNSYAESSFQFTSSDALSKTSITDKNNPDVQHVNTPELYTWLKEKFKEYEENEDKKEDAESQYDDEKNTGENAVKDLAPGNYRDGNEINELSDLPSASYTPPDTGELFSANITNVSKFVTGLFGDLSGTLGDALVNLRDDLFVLDYVMSMFSYDTYEKEGQYKLVKEEGKSEEDAKTAWADTDVKFTENKTLTNKMINSTNNYAYGSEVEYILYGGTNAENKDSSYGTIFCIRFVLNLMPQAQRYFTGECGTSMDVLTLKSHGASVQAATYGIIPEMLYRGVVMLGLTAMEAVKDIQYLQTGKPLALIKEAKDLQCLYLASGTEKEDDGSGFFYSDYLKLILFLKLTGGDADGIYVRIADVVQGNMTKTITKKSFSMSKATVYYQAKATVQVEPLLLELPIVTNNGITSPDDGSWNQISYSGVKGY